MAAGTTFRFKAQALILRRVLRFATLSALGRAWTQKSTRWLSIAGALVLFRLMDRQAARASARAKGKKAS